MASRALRVSHSTCFYLCHSCPNGLLASLVPGGALSSSVKGHVLKSSTPSRSAPVHESFLPEMDYDSEISSGPQHPSSSGTTRARRSDNVTDHSRASSMDGLSSLGHTLTRTTTNPPASSTRLPPSRNMTSANKLARMGFVPNDMASRTGNTAQPAAKRFGLKNLMQSFKKP